MDSKERKELLDKLEQQTKNSEQELKDSKQQLKEYGDRIYEYYKDNANNLDRYFLTLSSTLLVLSIAFINNAVDVDVATCRCLLLASWGLFAFTILSVILSLQLSQVAIKEYIKYIEDKEKQKKQKKIKNWDTIINKVLPRISSISFIAAIVCLVIFVAINI